MARLALRLALLPAFLLAACATTVHELPSTYAPEAQSEAVVIGRLNAGLTSPAEPIGVFGSPMQPELMVHNETNDEFYTIVCGESGSDAPFHVALSPGHYHLETVILTVSWLNTMVAHPVGTFSVPSSGIVYVGTLRFRPEGSNEAGAAGRVPGGWVVEDHSEEAIAAFRAKYPQLDAPVHVSLILVSE